MGTRLVVAVGAALLALGGCTSTAPVETPDTGVRTVAPSWSGDITDEDWGAPSDPGDRMILDGYGIDPAQTHRIATTVRSHGLQEQASEADDEDDQVLVVDVIGECSIIELGERTWSQFEDGVREKRGLSKRDARGLTTYLRGDFCPGLSTDPGE